MDFKGYEYEIFSNIDSDMLSFREIMLESHIGSRFFMEKLFQAGYNIEIVSARRPPKNHPEKNWAVLHNIGEIVEDAEKYDLVRTMRTNLSGPDRILASMITDKGRSKEYS